MQGASATEHTIHEFLGKPVRVFVVWEPVLPTDWASPSTAALNRISDTRAAQFWDKGRLISHSMGEHDRRSIVWDTIAIYGAGAVWDDRPPEPLYQSGPVVWVAKQARAALAHALQAKQ
ncbi:MAG: hypothetical protein ACRD9L_18595 [Bryobacteraceae bacterium]